MELWTEVRHKVIIEGVSKRSICREYGLGHRTVEKSLRYAEPLAIGWRSRGRSPSSSVHFGDRGDPGRRSRSLDPQTSSATPPAESSSACATSTAIGARRSRSVATSDSPAGTPRRSSSPLSHPPREAQFVRRSDGGDRRRAHQGRLCGDDAAVSRTRSTSRPIPASAPGPSRPAASPPSRSSALCPPASPMTTRPSP